MLFSLPNELLFIIYGYLLDYKHMNIKLIEISTKSYNINNIMVEKHSNKIINHINYISFYNSIILSLSLVNKHSYSIIKYLLRIVRLNNPFLFRFNYYTFSKNVYKNVNELHLYNYYYYTQNDIRLLKLNNEYISKILSFFNNLKIYIYNLDNRLYFKSKKENIIVYNNMLNLHNINLNIINDNMDTKYKTKISIFALTYNIVHDSKYIKIYQDISYNNNNKLVGYDTYKKSILKI